MNWLDVALILLVGSSAVDGLWKGFARLAIGLAATLLGVMSGLWFYSSVGAFFESYVRSRAIANFLGFFLILFAFLLLGALVIRIVSRLVRWVGMSWFDRVMGALFGFVRGVVIGVALVMALLAFSSAKPPSALLQSRYAPYFIDAARYLSSVAPRELKDAVQENYKKFLKGDRRNVPQN